MIDREDGPVKHYRAICDKCGRKTRRQAEGFDFDEYVAKGWQEVEDEYGELEIHHCPKCASNTPTESVKEVIPSEGNKDDLSDHDAVHLPITRKDKNTLVINLGNGRKWVITSNTTIKVEQHEE